MSLIIFYGITFFGTALSAVASFLTIVPTFGSNSYLGIALGAKTLFLSLVAPYVVRFLRSHGPIKTIAGSQILGAIFLGIVAVGISQKDFPLFIVGILLSGIPSTVISVAAPIILKRSSTSEVSFRKLQGYMRIMGSTCVLIAMAASPLLLEHFGLYSILAFDFLTYIVAIPLIFMIKVDNHRIETSEASQGLLFERFKKLGIAEELGKPRFQAFIWITLALFIMRGLAPIIAGGTPNVLTENMPPFWKTQMWTIESLAEMFAGVLYTRIGLTHLRKLPDLFLYMNSLILLPVVLFGNLALLVPALFVVFAISELGLSVKRDDLFLSATTDDELGRLSAFSVLYTNLLMAASPLLMGAALNLDSAMLFVVSIAFLQGFLYVTSRLSTVALKRSEA